MRNRFILLILSSVSAALTFSLIACQGQSVPIASNSTTTMVPIESPISAAHLTETPMAISTPRPFSVTPTIIPTAIITPITDFNAVAAVFESKELSITVDYPLGWVVKQNLDSHSIIVVDDWEKFTKGNANADAIGILILAQPDTGSAQTILNSLVTKLKNLSGQVGASSVEEHDGQEFAWAEYAANSLSDNSQIHYFLTAIATKKRSAVIFASVNTDRQDKVRPIYRAIVERIVLH